MLDLQQDDRSGTEYSYIPFHQNDQNQGDKVVTIMERVLFLRLIMFKWALAIDTCFQILWVRTGLEVRSQEQSIVTGPISSL